MKVLVTGGAGYIGSHACKALAKAGHQPIAYDNLVHGHRESVRWGPLVEGDIGDRRRLDEAFRKFEPGAVMHFAAYAYVGESVQDPGKYYRNNVAGTLTLLEAMRDHAIDRLVFSSTCATYGLPEAIPMGENHPQAPINPYGASKLMVERMIADFSVAHGLRAVALRYFNAAGADPDGEIGEDHSPETHLIPLALAAALGRIPELTIFGDDYDTEDGTCVRDYVHVSDLADAHVLALAALDNSTPGLQAYNLGNGRGHSVSEVVQSIERVTGHKVPLAMGPRRAGDPPRLVSETMRAREGLGWAPRHSSIDRMVATAYGWMKKSGTSEQADSRA